MKSRILLILNARVLLRVDSQNRCMYTLGEKLLNHKIQSAYLSYSYIRGVTNKFALMQYSGICK